MSKNISKEELIIAEFEKDVDIIANILSKWGYDFYSHLCDAARIKASVNDRLFYAVKTPEERKAISENWLSKGRDSLYSKTAVVAVAEILESLDAGRSKVFQGCCKDPFDLG